MQQGNSGFFDLVSNVSIINKDLHKQGILSLHTRLFYNISVVAIRLKERSSSSTPVDCFVVPPKAGLLAMTTKDSVQEVELDEGSIYLTECLFFI
jgi:hypothetical protein